ncbi:hypothetical protein DYB36_001747 [Aphanomyces astaci]|uniref:3'-5' exonuclease domain-containing protein n=2 Tax=Aphanomyces astaci TaxID=112090 RepID=A0A397BBG0_APHAT|nr:hypothetical protein DYB36_001747 [Aphanomyces astaci]
MVPRGFRRFSSRRSSGRRQGNAYDDDGISLNSQFGKKTLNRMNAHLAAFEDKQRGGPREPSAREVKRWEKIMAKKSERTLTPEYLAQPIFRPNSAALLHFGDKSMVDYEDKVPVGVFPGAIHVVSTAEEELQHRAALESMRVVGIDCETKPSLFRNYASSPIALVQLASHDTALLYRVRWIDPNLTFPGLQHVLANKDTIKVGHGCAFDFKSLRECRVASHVVNTVDTLPVATKIGCLKPNLRALGMIWQHLQISKAMQTSNWEAPLLTNDQVEYAATDAWLARQGLMQFAPSRPYLTAVHYTDSRQGDDNVMGSSNDEIVAQLLEVAQLEQHRL